MKHYFTLLFTFCISISLTGQSLSPHIITSINGFSQEKSALVSRTAEETMTSSHSSSENIFLNRDFQQQPDQTAASAERIKLSDSRFKVYPNPATDFIKVEWVANNPSEFIVELYDLVGRRIIRKKSEYPENIVQIQMQSLQRSAYLLKVYTSDSKYSRTLRIVKY